MAELLAQIIASPPSMPINSEKKKELFSCEEELRKRLPLLRRHRDRKFERGFFFFFKVSSLMKVVYVVLFIHLYFAGLASTNIVDKHADFKRQ